MRVVRLRIFGFRGIKIATLHFGEHTVLIGANGSGKSTVVDALALVFGRELMVRDLTEHDFFGSTPEPASRFRIVATLAGFDSNDPEANDQWFREGRAVPKWWSEALHVTSPEKSPEFRELCVEIGYGVRFDHETLSVERVRYFHDDDSIEDPFLEEAVAPVPARLLADVGLFVVPASRTRERTLSFASEIFRRVVVSQSAMPANEILAERNRLRNPVAAIESAEGLKQIAERINAEFARLLPNSPKFQLRITGTDSEAVLQALVPHYQHASGGSLPVHRHGSGLLSLQTMILLLEFGRIRREANASFILAIEEPELHLPPGLQRRVVYRARTASHQTITTTHASRVAAFYDPTSILVIENRQGTVRAEPLSKVPLGSSSPNWQRRLLMDSRIQLTEALMHEVTLVPEGRTDFDYLRLLVERLETSDAGAVQFGTRVGVVPTHDASVLGTYEQIAALRDNVAALLDGDQAGDQYLEGLMALAHPPSVILQWPAGKTMEDVIGRLLEGLSESAFSDLSALLPYPVASLPELVQALKTERNKTTPMGMKSDLLAYESVTRFIRDSEPCAKRTIALLDAMDRALSGMEQPHFVADPRSTHNTAVLRWNDAADLL